MVEKENQRTGIYLEPQIENLPEYYDRDIIKVISKNPKEVFIMWGISLRSQERIQNFFQAAQRDIRYKLYVRYQDGHKDTRTLEIYLEPFTDSYVVKFEFPVHNLRVEVLGYNDRGEVYSLMHSAHISLPANRPSKKVHRDWVNYKWVQEGIISSEEIGEVVPELEVRNFWQEAYGEGGEKESYSVIERFDGSSGGHFSSHTVSSWGKR